MIVVAITGASGVIYGIRLLEALKELNIPVTFQVYKGTAKTYITFFEYNMQNEEYSDSIKDMMIRQLSYANRYNQLINIVEEPELSLFPCSQMGVLKSLISNNACSDENMLVFTTHSPYSLAIINTMIMGAKAYANANDEQKEEIEDILPLKYQIKNDEIAAYRLSSSAGIYCESIINSKTGLISKHELDSASDDIMKLFNSLYQYYAKTITR